MELSERALLEDCPWPGKRECPQEILVVWVSQKGVSVIGQRIFNRETRENRESVYGLFFLVRAVRVVCGS